MMNTDPIETFSASGKPAGGSKEAVKKAQTATVRMMRAGSEDIVVGENSSLEGSFETQGSMFVDGSMTRADLRTTLLSIGVSGAVEGNATASRAEIAGSFDGHLVVSGEVILRSTSHITGDIQCGKLVSHRGATIRAQVTVLEDEDELTVGPDDALPGKAHRLQRKITGAFIRRSTTFGYGVFFTLGTLGIASFLFH